MIRQSYWLMIITNDTDVYPCVCVCVCGVCVCVCVCVLSGDDSGGQDLTRRRHQKDVEPRFISRYFPLRRPRLIFHTHCLTTETATADLLAPTRHNSDVENVSQVRDTPLF